MRSSSVGRLACRPSATRDTLFRLSPPQLRSVTGRARHVLQTQRHAPTTKQDFHTITRHYFKLPSLSSLISAASSAAAAASTSNSAGPDGSSSSPPPRLLTASRTLPYKPEPLFQIISSVESYSQFLPFLNASTVTARDPETGYPTRADLTAGYGPLSETFTSRVDCDKDNWVVEARSGVKYALAEQSPTTTTTTTSSSSSATSGTERVSGEKILGVDDEGIFEYLSTRWKLVPVKSGQNNGQIGVSTPQTRVDLEIRFKFRNQLHAAMMSAVEDRMAGLMVEAFEKRIREVEGLK